MGSVTFLSAELKKKKKKKKKKKHHKRTGNVACYSAIK